LNNASNRNELLELAAEVLEEKSEKFKAGCGDVKLWQLGKQFHCHRRAGRMMRSAELLSRATTSAASDAENQQHIQRAFNNIASAFGTDQKYLLEFKDKVKGDFLSIAKDPTRKFKRMISTVRKLLTGSESDKNEARKEITKMPSRNVTRVSRREAKRVERTVNKLARRYKLKQPKVVDQAWADVDKLIPNETASETPSALLQLETLDAGQAKGGVNLMIVVIVVILILLLCIPGFAIPGVLMTVIIVVLVLILIIMLVKVLVGQIRRLGGGGSRRRNGGGHHNGRGGNRRNGHRR